MDNYFKTNNSDTKFVGIVNHKINLYKYTPLRVKDIFYYLNILLITIKVCVI